MEKVEPKLEWKEDQSPLHMMGEGRTTYVDGWQLRVDKIKPASDMLNTFMQGMDLSDREKEVLAMRQGLDDEERAKAELRERRRKNREEYPYHWSVSALELEEGPMPFTGMSGRAKTEREAKLLAEHALQFAQEMDKLFEKYEPFPEEIDWFGGEG